MRNAFAAALAQILGLSHNNCTRPEDFPKTPSFSTRLLHRLSQSIANGTPCVPNVLEVLATVLLPRKTTTILPSLLSTNFHTSPQTARLDNTALKQQALLVTGLNVQCSLPPQALDLISSSDDETQERAYLDQMRRSIRTTRELIAHAPARGPRPDLRSATFDS